MRAGITTVRRACAVTRADLQEAIDEAVGILDDAYEPESIREELAEAVGHALDVLKGEDGDDEDGEDVDAVVDGDVDEH